MSIIHPTLYRKDARGKLRVWWVEQKLERYRIFDGLGDGNPKAPSEWTTCEAKNVGKANHLTPIEQCTKEVQALYTKKLDRKYHLTPECTDPKPIFPMLAQTYAGWDKLPIDHSQPHNLIQVFTQPKLNGVRCLASKQGLQSREGKPLNLPHIMEDLTDFFAAFPDVVLDGELYLHELREDLGEIVSMVRHGDYRLQLHVYDMVDTEQDFGGRTQWLMILDRYTGQSIVRVKTHYVPNVITLNCLYQSFLKDGYEGQMVRIGKGFYETSKRSGFLLKRKEWQDAEFLVNGFEMGNGNYAGLPKRVTCELPDGRTFGAGVKGNKAYLKGILHRPRIATATIKFFAYTPDGIPQFPVAVAFYDEKRDL